MADEHPVLLNRRWPIAALFPEEARRYVAGRAHLYTHVIGTVRVAVDDLCCPVSDLISYSPVWAGLSPYERDQWKEVLDDGTVVASIIDDLDWSGAPRPEQYLGADDPEGEYSKDYERWLNFAVAAVDNFCSAWDDGSLSTTDLPTVLGVSRA